jgi:hypothetical protein
MPDVVAEDVVAEDVVAVGVVGMCQDSGAGQKVYAHIYAVLR